LGFIGKWAFKVWIMFMLVGYFVFFMAIALFGFSRFGGRFSFRVQRQPIFFPPG